MKVLIFENNVSILTAIERLLFDFGFRVILAHDLDDFSYAINTNNISFLVFNEVLFRKSRIHKMIQKNCSDCSFISYFLESSNLKKTVHLKEKIYDITRQNTAEILSTLIRLYFLRNGFSVFDNNFFTNQYAKSLYTSDVISAEFLSEFKKSLTKKAEKIFNVLNEYSESGIKSTEIAEKIWGSCSEKTLNSIYVHISFLRKKLKAHFNGKYIITKEEKTYRLKTKAS